MPTTPATPTTPTTQNLIIAITLAFLSSLAPTTFAQDPLFKKDHQNYHTYTHIPYDQPFRSQFHFSSRKNWINDPNGLVYYAGEYHLYFQHCALTIGPGEKSWGHAVSTDMVHWTQLPHAISPYTNGAIWSGTAVVDHNNTLGKQTTDTKTIVAYFTKTQPAPLDFIQCAAYSTDKGRTFTLINQGKAIVPNQGFSHGERDPKVFWNPKTKKWVMVLILGGKERVIRFFTSTNMVDWQKAGDINRKWAAECIDLFPLPVDNNPNNIKWVLADASYDYQVGDLKNNIFQSDNPNFQGDWGAKVFYAAQVFNNTPDNRIVQVGWMKNKDPQNVFLANKMPFNQQMAFPNDLTLRTTPDGIRLFRWPIKEIENLYTQSHTFENINGPSANVALKKLKPELIDLSIEFEPTPNQSIELNIRGHIIRYPVTKEYRNATGKHKTPSIAINDCLVPAAPINGKLSLRILLDRTSLELFVNQGHTVGTTYITPNPNNHTLTIHSSSPLKINTLTLHELKSSWR